MRRLAVPLVAVLAVQPLAVLLPTIADAFPARPHPVAPAVVRLDLAGVDRTALAAERSAGRALTLGTEATERTGTPGGTGTPATAGGLRVALLTPARNTRSFAVAGLTWTGAVPAGTAMSIRVREGGRWGAWTPVPASDDGPDAGTAEAARSVSGSEPLLTTGGADGVQVKVLSATGSAPAGLRLALVDPGTSAADGVVGATGTASAAAAGARPTVLPRRDWGADESLREQGPTYVTDLRAGVLHHTAGSNGYTAASVPSQLRGIYAYHTQVRGWNDIAYNLLVDRFGRVWEGRWGGVGRPVQGAHALGFNGQTFGVAAMGTLDSVQPSAAMLTAIAKVFAWKFSVHRIDPRGTTVLTSAGNLKYPAGARVTRTTMLGHRDVGPTACPGGNLYAKLAALRSQVATRVGAETLAPAVTPRTVVAGEPTPITVSARFTLAQSWTVTVTSACSPTPVWRRTGSGRSMTAAWPQTTSSGARVPPGTYVVTLTARTSTSRATPYAARVEVLPDVTSPLGTCPAVRVAGRTAASVADGARRLAGPSRVLVVVPAEASHRRESVSAGALARAIQGRLVSSPGGTLSATVLDRVRRDGVTRVYLVGVDGSWSAGVSGQLGSLGATVTTIGGATANDVLAAAARRAAQGRTVATAMLVDPADPVAAAAAAATGATLGHVVLAAGPGGIPAATTAAMTDLGITRAVLGGTGGPGPAAVTALRGTMSSVVDVRASTRDGALVKLAGRYPGDRLATVVLVPVTGTDGLEALLTSTVGRPQLALTDGHLAPGGLSWLGAHRGTTRRVAVAATPALAPATFLAAAGRFVGGSATASVIPAGFAVRGSGFGHGAGMSQYGAYAMAQGGATYGRILSTYYPGTALVAVDGSRHLKVNLLHAATRATFGVGAAAGVTGPVSLRLSTSSGAVTLSGADTGAVLPAAAGGLEVWRGGRRVLTTTGAVHVTWTGTPDLPGNAAVARLSGTGSGGTKVASPYRYGELWAVRYGSGVEVVNEIALGRDYLRGIAEMPASWGVRGAAALQAQSVAARTFAWSRLQRAASAACGGCNVYDSPRDQVFRGYAVELGPSGGRWTAAVDATAGRILAYRGTPAETLYYSSSGGRTQDVRDVFGSARPYLVSVADPYSLDTRANNPYRAWRRTVSQASMRAVFGLGDVVSVTVTSRTAGNAARTVTARSSAGRTATVTGTQLRSRLALPATWVWSVSGS